MPEPRRHHYIPKSFLASWTNDGTAGGRLNVIDRSTGRSWTTGPINAGVEANLYTLDLSVFPDGLKATEIEDSLAQIEGAAMPVIKRLVAGDNALSGDDRENVLALAATLTLRVPARLDWIEGILKQGYIRGSSPAPAAEPIPEKLNAVIEAVMTGHENALDRDAAVVRNEALAMAFSHVALVFRLLMARRWTVLRVIPDAGDLICTDHPVMLDWIKAATDGASPGFGMRNTAVFVPCGPTTALCGLWDAEPKDRSLSERQVAFWNGQLLGRVDRFVFSRGDFAELHKSDVIDRRDDVIRRRNETKRVAAAPSHPAPEKTP